VRGALTIAGGVIAAGDVWLVVISWKRRSVLGGFLGAVGIPTVLASVLTDPTQGIHEDALLIAAIMAAIGFVLYALGQALQRLLDDHPDDR